nr:hypothetical protein [Tanacetum cinerariifolium]
RTQKDTELPQTSVPLNLGANEDINQEEGDRVERAITTDASLEAAQDSDNITKTHTKTMPNVDIPQPNDPPLTEGHTSGSREGRLEENIKLKDIVPTPNDPPLTGAYTPRCDEGRITLAELMETCTILSNRVTKSDTELSITKAIYNKAFITLTNRVKKLESQLKQKRSRAVIHSSDKEGPKEFSNDKGKGIMQETEVPKKLKKKEMIQLSLDEELAQKLYAEELEKKEARQEQERYKLEKSLELQRQLDQRKENVPKGDQAKEINWNDPQVLRYHSLQNIPFLKAKVRRNMIMIWDQVHTFVPKDSEIEREVMKRAGFDLHQGSSKKQRLDQQTEETEEEARAQGDSDQ